MLLFLDELKFYARDLGDFEIGGVSSYVKDKDKEKIKKFYLSENKYYLLNFNVKINKKKFI